MYLRKTFLVSFSGATRYGVCPLLSLMEGNYKFQISKKKKNSDTLFSVNLPDSKHFYSKMANVKNILNKIKKMIWTQDQNMLITQQLTTTGMGIRYSNRVSVVPACWVRPGVHQQLHHGSLPGGGGDVEQRETGRVQRFVDQSQC